MRLLLVVALLSCVLADYPPVAVTSTSTEAQNGGGLSECDDFTDEASCVAFGSRDTPVGDYGACVWCGRSATDGLCREPFWSGNYSCPAASASLWNYNCLPGDTIAACGSYCNNVCETECRDYRAPVYSITLFSDANCTVETAQERNLTRACLPLSNGGSIGMIKFDDNTFTELSFLCADCSPCEPTCSDDHAYCACNKVAGVSDLYYVVRPSGHDVCRNGTLSTNARRSAPLAPRDVGLSHSAAVAPAVLPFGEPRKASQKRRRFLSQRHA